ncbi:MAG: carbohydrate ABC transporter permease [Clostridiaceae bacterium]|nr:carbohydrate ABC transporter permease [Clostridiaceae bacterium]
MFFKSYSAKKDGAIRSFDLHSFRVKLLIICIVVICAIIAFVCLFPTVWVFLASFKDIREFRREVTIFPSKFDFSVFVKTWNDLKFIKYYINSLIMVVGCVICSVIFNGLIAYVLGILKPKGHQIVTGLVMWSLLIPSTTSIVALFVNVNRLGLSRSFIPIWLSYGANAFIVVLYKQYFERMPADLFEAAKLDGCNVLQVFLKILVPLSTPIISVATIFTITAAWSDFLFPFLILNGTGKETVMIAIFSFRTSNATDVEVLRAILFSIIPPTILFLIFQKQITDGAAAGALKE